MALARTFGLVTSVVPAKQGLKPPQMPPKPRKVKVVTSVVPAKQGLKPEKVGPSLLDRFVTSVVPAKQGLKHCGSGHSTG